MANHQKISLPVSAEPTTLDSNNQVRSLPLPPSAASTAEKEAIVEEAVAAAAQSLAPGQTLDVEKLGQVIGDAVAAGIAKTQAPRAIKFGEYVRRQPKKPELAHIFYQNGYMLSKETLTTEEITLLNKISHSGRYIDRRVEVIVEEGSGDVRISYNNKTIDQRLDNKESVFVGGFVGLLRAITAAQDLENLDADQRQASRLARR